MRRIGYASLREIQKITAFYFVERYPFVMEIGVPEFVFSIGD